MPIASDLMLRSWNHWNLFIVFGNSWHHPQAGKWFKFPRFLMSGHTIEVLCSMRVVNAELRRALWATEAIRGSINGGNVGVAKKFWLSSPPNAPKEKGNQRNWRRSLAKLELRYQYSEFERSERLLIVELVPSLFVT